MEKINEKQKFDIKLDEIVPEYYSKNKHVKKIFFERLKIALDYLKLVKPEKVLDAGCGDGLFTSKIKETIPSVKKVVGIDLNKNILVLNEKYDTAEFKQENLYELNYKNEYDAITVLDVLEHFEDVEPVILNLKNALKDNGYLIVSGPVESFWYKLGRLVIKGSFSDETGPGAGKHYYNIIGLDKIIRKHFKRIKRKKIKFLFVHLFDVNLYKKI